MKKFLLVLLVLLFFLSATGCRDMAVKNNLIGGKYRSLDDYAVSLEFNRNGKVTVEDYEYDCEGVFEWHVDGDCLVIGDFEFEYEIVGDSLLTLEYEGYRISFMCVY